MIKTNKKLLVRLEQLKLQLLTLRREPYTSGKRKFYSIYNKIQMMIRRLYKNPNEIQSKLFPLGINSAPKTFSQRQQDYLFDIDQTLRAIDTIKDEFELFGFKDYITDKNEIEWKFGHEKIGFLRKSKEN